jgi:hypothetical protein
METKPKKELTHDQIEELKARLLKAREAKLNKKRVDYVQKKEEIKEEGLKKRTLKKIQSLVEKGTVKEDELKEILPKKEAVKQIPVDKIVEEVTKEIPFELPLPSKRVSKSEHIKQPEVIPFEEPLKASKSKPVDIPKKDKDRFMKLVYYKEPSKKTLKRLEKLQESSSSSSESESEDECPFKDIQQPRKPQNDENAFYKHLAMKYYG